MQLYSCIKMAYGSSLQLYYCACTVTLLDACTFRARSNNTTYIHCENGHMDTTQIFCVYGCVWCKNRTIIEPLLGASFFHPSRQIIRHNHTTHWPLLGRSRQCYTLFASRSKECSSFARIRSWKVLLIRHDQIQKSAPHSPRSDLEKCSSFATTRSRKVLLICHDQIKKSAADYQIEEAASILPPPHNQNATHCPPPGRRSASKSTLPPSDCELATHCPPPGRRSATVLTAHFQIKEMLKNVQLQVEGVPQCSLPTSR
jgi:hypothetical protein